MGVLTIARVDGLTIAVGLHTALLAIGNMNQGSSPLSTPKRVKLTIHTESTVRTTGRPTLPPAHTPLQPLTPTSGILTISKSVAQHSGRNRRGADPATGHRDELALAHRTTTSADTLQTLDRLAAKEARGMYLSNAHSV